MGFSNVQIAQLKCMKKAAKDSLRYFKEIKSVRSFNNPFDRTTQAEENRTRAYRADGWKKGYTSISQDVEDASHFQLGNCQEKASIVYSSLASNSLLHHKKMHVNYCESVGWDHVFVIVTDVIITGNVRLSSLSEITMVVDGWTEDWYFPVLSWTSARWYGISNMPNPRQIYVRGKTAANELRVQDRRMTPAGNKTVHSRRNGQYIPNYQSKGLISASTESTSSSGASTPLGASLSSSSGGEKGVFVWQPWMDD